MDCIHSNHDYNYNAARRIRGITNIKKIIGKRTHNLPGISKSADMWLTIKKYKETNTCIDNLKRKGYQLWVTDLSPEAIPLNNIKVHRSNGIAREKQGIEETNHPFSATKERLGEDGSLKKKGMRKKQKKKKKEDIFGGFTLLTLFSSCSNNSPGVSNSEVVHWVEESAKIALVFGNEMDGVTNAVRESAGILSSLFCFCSSCFIHVFFYFPTPFVFFLNIKRSQVLCSNQRILAVIQCFSRCVVYPQHLSTPRTSTRYKKDNKKK